VCGFERQDLMRVLHNPSNWRDPGTPAGRAGMVEPDVFLRHSLREQARLPRENAELRQACADLTAAAETWIRLYEAALARANAAEAVIAELSDRTKRAERAS
jgi:hypothetical protein